MEKTLNFNRRTICSRFNSLSEQELIKMSISGDSEAFAELIKLNKEYLYRVAYIYLKDINKSLDALQECTYKSFKSIKTLREPKYFKSWITRILINISIESLKADSKIIYIEDNNPLISENTSLDIEENLDLYNAIEMLKEDYKIVVVMKYFNDMSVEEISSILNTPANTIKTRLSRARQVLKNILKEDYPND